MSQVAIHVDHLGKRYLIDHRSDGGRRYVALRDVITQSIKGIGKQAIGLLHQREKLAPDPRHEEFWALKDLTFSIDKGDRVGIIGPNGAGKSTLLKILSRITEPTTGMFRIEGRVSSLLEVGTGFHPELTGSENIYLNGAILGMARAEIRRKFDDIVGFADVERFLDTPVKRYSSGMYVRLAFSVAAHLEPEILIIDEVLAVGDAAFQKKCLGKMEEVGREGRTVLFVSHSMPMIKQLCNKGILLNRGVVAFNGAVSDTIGEYEKGIVVNATGIWINENNHEFEKAAYIRSIEILDNYGKRADSFLNTEPVTVRIVVIVNEESNYLKVGFDLVKNAATVFRSEQVDSPRRLPVLPVGQHTLVCEIPPNFLNAGRYYLIPQISIHCVVGLRASQESVLMFGISINPQTSEFHTVLNDQNHPGSVFPLFSWRLE